MPSQFRYEYHLIENRVVERRIRRPASSKRWAYDLTQSTLIAVLDPDDNSFQLRRGPAATDPLVLDAVLRYERLYADVGTTDISKDLSATVAKDAAVAIKDIINDYAKQFRSFANEEDISGYVKGRLNDTVVSDEKTRVVIKTWTYARNPKERQLGVDIGVIFDISRADQRVVKAIWVQAKRSEEAPGDILTLQDLRGQLEDMRVHTSEAYAMVYTANEAQMYRADAPSVLIPVEEIVYDSLICQRGDRDPVVVALTGDSKVVLEVFVTT